MQLRKVSTAGTITIKSKQYSSPALLKYAGKAIKACVGVWGAVCYSENGEYICDAPELELAAVTTKQQ